MIEAAPALALAGLAMLAHGVASLAQASGATSAGGLRTLRHPSYLLGVGLDGVGWLAAVLALQALPLIVVQTFVAGSLAVTAVGARLRFGVRAGRWEIGAVAAVVAGLILVGLGAAPGPAHPAPVVLSRGLAVVLLGCAGAAIVAWRRRWSIGCALVAGTAFAGTAICGRALTSLDPGSLPTDPYAWGIAAGSLIGGLSYLRALECAGRRRTTQVTALLWVVEAALPTMVGVLLLGDRFRPGLAWAAVAGIVLAVAGAVALSARPVSTIGT